MNEISAYDKRRKNKERLGVLLSNFIYALKKSTQTPLSKRSCVRAKLGGKPPVLATASALSKEMLNTQNIPNKFKFSIERKLIGISEKMKKTVVDSFDCIGEGQCKEQKQYFRFYRKSYFFHGNTQGFSFRRSFTCVPLISRQRN